MTTEDVRGQKVAEGRVPPEWIDYNDHVNVAYYVLAFDFAVDALWARLGIDDEYVSTTRGSTFAVESHVTYQQELRLDDPYFVTVDVVAYDEKRIHQFQRMYHAERHYLAATAEWMNLHVNLLERRVSAWPGPVLEKLAVIAAGQSDVTMPDELCGKIRVKTPIYSIDGRGK
jgi:acyl-CoA thioester hydrolase